MKKKTIIPIAFAAVMMFGCAGSDNTMNDTTAMDTSTTMSETQTMGGDTPADYNTTTNATTNTNMSARAYTYEEIIGNTAQNDVDYGDMFENMDTKQHDVLTLAKSDPNLSTFTRLIEMSGMEANFMRLDEYTLLAPSNAAFAAMDRQKLEMLLMPDNKAKLMQVLQAHVLPSKVSAAQFNTTQRIQIGENRYIPINVTMNGTNVAIGGANVARSNVEASNGYIHVMDNVILPDEVAVEGGTGVGGY